MNGKCNFPEVGSREKTLRQSVVLSMSVSMFRDTRMEFNIIQKLVACVALISSGLTYQQLIYYTRIIIIIDVNCSLF